MESNDELMYKAKYLKYKEKYMRLKQEQQMTGGDNGTEIYNLEKRGRYANEHSIPITLLLSQYIVNYSITFYFGENKTGLIKNFLYPSQKNYTINVKGVTTTITADNFLLPSNKTVTVIYNGDKNIQVTLTISKPTDTDSNKNDGNNGYDIVASVTDTSLSEQITNEKVSRIKIKL